VVVRKDPDSAMRYSLVRAGGPRMGALEARPRPSDARPITDVLSGLGGGGTGEEGRRLAALDIDYVYLSAPTDPVLVSTLDSLPGLTRSSAEDGDAAWLVDRAAGERVAPLRSEVHTWWADRRHHRLADRAGVVPADRSSYGRRTARDPCQESDMTSLLADARFRLGACVLALGAIAGAGLLTSTPTRGPRAEAAEEAGVAVVSRVALSCPAPAPGAGYGPW
jgi:hypothetical protein